MGGAIPIREYWVVRPRPVMLLAQAPIAAAILGYWAWTSGAGASLVADGVGLGLVLVTCLVCLSAAGLDRLLLDPSPDRFLAQSFIALGAGLIAIAAVFQLLPDWAPGEAEVIGIALGTAALPWTARFLLPKLVARGQVAEAWLILGEGPLAADFYDALQSELPRNTSLIAVHMSGENGSGSGRRIDCEQLRGLTSEGRISKIIVAQPLCQSDVDLASALVDCKLNGVEVEEAIDVYERLHRKIWVEALRTEWLILCDGFNPSRAYMRVKRLVDLLGAVSLLLLTLPVMALVALGIKLTSPGPVFFRQERVGFHGKRFVLVKFRSMRADAEQSTGPVWARENDDRITPLGRLLRKSRLDETPQVWNVLRGEMSFIGPRPERPHFVSRLQERFPYYNLRHHVRPGITGWAQVMYPYGASFRDSYEKLQYDLYYARHISFGLDVSVALKTLQVIFMGRGR